MKKLKNIPQWLTEMPRKVKEREQWFQSLTREKARIAILFDAYELVRLQRIFLETGSYVNVHQTTSFSDDYIFNDVLEKTSGRSFLNKPNKELQCNVCHLGAMLCSWTHFNNKHSLFDLREHSHKSEIHEQLDKYFTAEELQLFETIFEGTDYLEDFYVYVDVDILNDDFIASERFEILVTHLIETGCPEDNLEALVPIEFIPQ